MSSHISLVLSAIAISLSVVSLAFGAYQQYFKKPVLSVLLSLRMSVFYEHDGRLYMDLTVAISNKGAQYAAIRALGGKLHRKADGASVTFRWVAFLKQENIAKPGEGYRALTSIEQLAELLVVPSRTALTRKIQFITNEEFTLSQGQYSMELWVFEGLSTTSAATRKGTFTVSDKAVASMVRADKETHLTQKMVVIPLEMML